QSRAVIARRWPVVDPASSAIGVGTASCAIAGALRLRAGFFVGFFVGFLAAGFFSAAFFFAAGFVRLADCFVRLADGFVRLADGFVRLADGFVRLADGRLLLPTIAAHFLPNIP